MKVLMVIAQKDFRDEEFFEPREVFIKNGTEVKVASQKLTEARGRLGGTTIPDVTIGEAEAQDFAAVIFVGGPGAAVYLNDSAAHKLARDFYAAGKIVAAICLGPSILANAGLLRGVRATCTPSEQENLKMRGAEYTGAPVEVDGKIVTACGPEASREFGKKIVELLKQ
ncbi:DJ-1/PfpI family protein [Candidatus Falkowbacteria bacterium]|nr:DJ-1/PfpI family protein [Candidatus Falkowbacteria bacterium]